MAAQYNHLTVILAFLCFASCYGGRLPLTQQPHQNLNFIRTSCTATRYPALCFSSLSAYARKIQTSPTKLANTALSVSLNVTRSASTAMKAMSASSGKVMSRREASARGDCIKTMGAAVDNLQQSLGMMRKLGGRDIGFQLNSVQTWVSAALTNDNTCIEGFDGVNGGVRDSIKGRVLKVAQLTSNALALVNCVVSTYTPAP